MSGPSLPTGRPALSDHDRDFHWRDGERLVRFARGAMSEAPELLAERGLEGYALLSTRRALESLPGAAGLASGAAVFLEVPPGPVPDAAASVREAAGHRPVVGLGGGRVIDSAKAIAAAGGLRCAAVPTTLSGAEMTRIHRLPAGVERPRHGLVRPELVVADPSAMASQPPAPRAASAMNALAHGVEALYGPGTNPVTELAALRGAELIDGGLEGPADEPDPLALAAILCAYALDSAGLGLHHAVCQTLVRTLGTPHAETNAVMLPHVVGYVGRHAAEEIGRLAHALGGAGAGPESAAARVAELSARAGVTRLGDLGVHAEAVESVVEAVMRRPEPATTPGAPGPSDVRELLLAAM